MHSWQTSLQKILGDRKKVGVIFHTSNQDLYQVAPQWHNMKGRYKAMAAIPISMTAKALQLVTRGAVVIIIGFYSCIVENQLSDDIVDLQTQN